MTQFTHLHVHTEYSMLDGATKISAMVDKAIGNGMRAVAVTDHGNMYAIKEFSDYVDSKNKPVLGEIKEIKSKIKDASDDEKVALQQQLSNAQDKLFKPIFGCEVYVAPGSRFVKKKEENDRGYHLILLAKNLKGYHNLAKMVSYGFTEGSYHNMRIDRELIEKYHENIICCTACLGGEIPQFIMKDKLDKAEESLLWYKNIFGDDYYIELQRHKATRPEANQETFAKQQFVNAKLIEYSKKYGIKIIATNDVHFLEEEHAEAHDRLVCLSLDRKVDEPHMRYSMQEWFKTREEMEEVFADIPEAIENTQEIADKVEFYSINNPPIMPMFEIPETFGTTDDYKKKYTHEDLIAEFETDESTKGQIEKLGGFDKVYRIKLESDYLRKITMDGAHVRYGKNIPADVMERLNFELNVMRTMGFPGYFLIVQDLIAAARAMGVSVGPGRGSAAGSVVAYCLKITDIDPLKYDLLFERFLNPDRISLPDIDIDFDDAGRGDVLKWVKKKYGEDHVANIITFGTMATKSCIKDVARVENLPLEESIRLTKLIPDRLPDKYVEDYKKAHDGKEPKPSIKTCKEAVPEFKAEFESPNAKIANVLKYAEILEGTVRQVGVHACGVIIGADDLTNIVPMATTKEKFLNPETGKNDTREIMVTQYEGAVIESVGLVKMDFLGLRTLTIIREAISNIKKSKGIDIDIDTISINDKKTFELYCKGQTMGTFQFESPGMQKYLKDLQPSNIEDLIAMNALYRPGPMQYIPEFIDRKHGKKEIKYDFPIMEKRLKDTYGITVYQEQVMLLSRDLAGFTRGQSDNLRKAMGKKKLKEMEKLEKLFLEGAKKNGYGPEEKLKSIWKDWKEFAKYAFNKSHATCYSWVSYQTAYLKAHYPSEYMAAVLTNSITEIKSVTTYMEECKALKIKVLPPSVNESDKTFTVDKDGNIRFGLAAIKGFGEHAAENIIEERKKRPFTDIFDFVSRVSLTAVNRKALESLAYAGGFDEFKGLQRYQYFAPTDKGNFLDTLVWYGNLVNQDAEANTMSLFGGDEHSQQIMKPAIPQSEEWSVLEKLKYEREKVGIYLSSHPLDPFKLEMKMFCNIQFSEMKDLAKLQSKKLCFACMVNKVAEKLTRNGKPFGSVTFEDYNGETFTLTLFGPAWVNNKNYFTEGYLLMIKTHVEERKSWNQQSDANLPKEYELRIDTVMMLQDVRGEMMKSIEIFLPLMQINKDFTKKFVTHIKKFRGKKAVKFVIVDDEKNIHVTQTSRSLGVDLDDNLFDFLNGEDIKFKVEI